MTFHYGVVHQKYVVYNPYLMAILYGLQTPSPFMYTKHYYLFVCSILRTIKCLTVCQRPGKPDRLQAPMWSFLRIRPHVTKLQRESRKGRSWDFIQIRSYFTISIFF